MRKFIANLQGDAMGYVFINDEYFTWKPMLITKVLSFGTVKEIKIPINFIDGYKIERKLNWKFLGISVKGEEQMLSFECNPKRIVEELKKYNPYVRMIE